MRIKRNKQFEWFVRRKKRKLQQLENFYYSFSIQLELVEPPWAVNEDQIIALEMPFSNPFFVKHHTSTASKRKFIRFTVYSSNPASSQDNPSQQKQYSPCHDNASPFVLRNHTLSLSEPASKFDVNPLLADNITMVSDCIKFSYEI